MTADLAHRPGLLKRQPVRGALCAESAASPPTQSHGYREVLHIALASIHAEVLRTAGYVAGSVSLL